MASVSISPIGNGYQFFTAGGLIVPLSGGLLYTYAAGTSTPKTSYTDSLGLVPNSNPIVLSSDGRTPSEIWLLDGSAYKFVLADSLGVIIATYDNISGSLSSSSTQILSVPQYVSGVGGSANAITLTPTITPSTYTAGLTYTFSPPGTNTGPVTVNVSGLGVVNIRNKVGNLLNGGEMFSTGLYQIEYNVGTSSFYLINSDDGQLVSNATWTPTMAFGGAAAGVTYGTRFGQYVKLGNIVMFWFQLSLTNKGASVGNATIGGLPFTVSTSLGGGGNVPCGTVNPSQITFADKYLTISPQPNTTNLNLTSAPSAGGGPNFISDAGFVNTSSMFGFGMFPVG